MEENKLHYHMKVRVFRKEGAFGPGVAELMHHVEETGSLSEACRCMCVRFTRIVASIFSPPLFRCYETICILCSRKPDYELESNLL